MVSARDTFGTGERVTVQERVNQFLTSCPLEISRTGRREQVKLLDGLVRYRFGDNAELMGAWASARNVVGPFKSKGDGEGGAGKAPKAA
jgi:hypothetical protein